jgi:hypothetical protein
MYQILKVFQYKTTVNVLTQFFDPLSSYNRVPMFWLKAETLEVIVATCIVDWLIVTLFIKAILAKMFYRIHFDGCTIINIGRRHWQFPEGLQL